MKQIGFYNGRIAPLENLTMPILDRAVYFGDGVYDATYGRNKTPFALDDHIERFYSGCGKLEIPFDFERGELDALLRMLCRELDEDGDFMLYWQVSRGTGIRAHIFPDTEQSKPNLLIMVYEKRVMPVSKRLKLITLPDLRFQLCHIKTLNLIPSVLASQRVRESSADETVFHRDGVVTECAHSNVHILKDGVFRTHPLDCHILPGVTRKHLIQFCGELGIPVEERAFTLDEMLSADEVIVTSCGTLCNPVEEIDGVPVGGKGGAALANLQAAYEQRFLEGTLNS
ncbi:MAG: aminotransferase class IV [Oscillospiraceae bacterium]|jgi:D-alanine transaminase|nr:aminotransferase class IV [Oscillospiraceae bacterium]